MGKTIQKDIDMTIVTVNISVPHKRVLDMLVKAGRYASRSEVIRVAIRALIIRELEIEKKLEKMNTICEINVVDFAKILDNVKRKSVDMRIHDDKFDKINEYLDDVKAPWEHD